ARCRGGVCRGRSCGRGGGRGGGGGSRRGGGGGRACRGCGRTRVGLRRRGRLQCGATRCGGRTVRGRPFGLRWPRATANRRGAAVGRPVGALQLAGRTAELPLTFGSQRRAPRRQRLNLV